MASVSGNPVTPVVGIVWRNDPIREIGKGAFWDHYTLQKIINVPTYIIPWKEEYKETIKDAFRSYLEKNTIDIPMTNGINERSKKQDLEDELKRHGLNSNASTKAEAWRRLAEGKAKLPHTPPEVNGLLRCPGFRSVDDVDIIVIPGVAQEEDVPERAEFERTLLRTYAFKKKRFIILCGGVWRLEELGVTIGKVEDHSYSQMISLNLSGKINHNVEIHYVEIINCSTSERIWPNGLPEEFAVNSVHDKAIVDLGRMDDKLEVVARSTKVCENRLNRHSKEMIPTKCIEVVASKKESDFCLVAIQWHLEAYCHEEYSIHKQLLEFVIKAPDPVVPVPATDPVVPVDQFQQLIL